MDALFIYGSLGPGKPNEHVLQAIGGSWESASLQGRLVAEGWGADMGFPGLIPDPEGESIAGHIFRSAQLENHWQSLDTFEGVEYDRVRVPALLASGDIEIVWVYALRN